MARKPDVFEQWIIDILNLPEELHNQARWDTRYTLLNRYHNRVRRMVAVYAKTYPVAEEMLENLDRMKKGK